jgi:hypothetical protein
MEIDIMRYTLTFSVGLLSGFIIGWCGSITYHNT